MRLNNSEIATKIEDLKNRLDMTTLFITSVQCNLTKKEDWAVMYALRNEKGLQHIDDLLTNVSTELQQLADRVIDGVSDD